MHTRSSGSGRSTLLTSIRRVAATRVKTMSDAEAAAATPVLAAPSTPRSSLEDLSEYTDADESVSSAPTEFLAEFLSALMQRDYETALKYCKLILQYEPNNTTAKDFYPLILEKIHLMKTQPDMSLESTSSSSSNDADRIDDNGNACPSTGASDGVSSTTTTTSSSSNSSSSSDSDSEGTTASYSSLEDDEADGNGNVSRATTSNLLPLTGTLTPQTVSSDSESPTEPVSQRLAQLRAQVVPHGRP